MATETMVPPTDPKAIREKVEAWHKTHKERYDAFKKQAEGVGNLDFSFFMKLMQFATDCIPQDRLEVCSYIFRLYCGDRRRKVFQARRRDGSRQQDMPNHERLL